jgi:hypothetical protein
MLSTLPFANMLANKNRAARRIAAQIASAFVPAGHLTPVIHEVLCYGCMAGLVMPIHHDIAPCEHRHDEDTLNLNDDSITPPEPVTKTAQLEKAVECCNSGASVLHVQVRVADGIQSRGMSMFNECRLARAPPSRG